LLKVDEKATFNAWYELLSDLEYDEVKSAFLQLATHAKFMPRPGDVRRTAIDTRNKVTPFLDAYSAWGIFQGILKEVHSGAQTERPPFDEALKNTLIKLGEVVYDMHTNGDREVFVRTYEQVVQKLEQDKYAIQKEDL
jgi:hypothetical protein